MIITFEMACSDYIRVVMSCIKDEITGSVICIIMKYAKEIKVTEAKNDGMFTVGYYDLEFEIHKSELQGFFNECNKNGISVMIL